MTSFYESVLPFGLETGYGKGEVCQEQLMTLTHGMCESGTSDDTEEQSLIQRQSICSSSHKSRPAFTSCLTACRTFT